MAVTRILLAFALAAAAPVAASTARFVPGSAAALDPVACDAARGYFMGNPDFDLTNAVRRQLCRVRAALLPVVAAAPALEGARFVCDLSVEVARDGGIVAVGIDPAGRCDVPGRAVAGRLIGALRTAALPPLEPPIGDWLRFQLNVRVADADGRPAVAAPLGTTVAETARSRIGLNTFERDFANARNVPPPPPAPAADCTDCMRIAAPAGRAIVNIGERAWQAEVRRATTLTLESKGLLRRLSRRGGAVLDLDIEVRAGGAIREVDVMRANAVDPRLTREIVAAIRDIGTVTGPRNLMDQFDGRVRLRLSNRASL